MVNQTKEIKRMAHKFKPKKSKRNQELFAAVGIFAKTLGVNPRNAMIEYFVEGEGTDYSLGDLAREYGLNKATTYNIARELLTERLIVPSRKVGRTQLYTLSNSKQAQRLLLISNLLLDESFKQTEEGLIER